MLSCSDDALCDERANPQSETCGSTTWAIAYFCTFIFLCMFFVSIYSFVPANVTDQGPVVRRPGHRIKIHRRSTSVCTVLPLGQNIIALYLRGNFIQCHVFTMKSVQNGLKSFWRSSQNHFVLALFSSL
jgi:hypothetical protein